MPLPTKIGKPLKSSIDQRFPSAYRGYQAASRIADAVKAAKRFDESEETTCKMKNAPKGAGDGGMPGNNQDQNKQARDAAVKAGLDAGERRELHDAISGQNYNYKQILEIAKDIKNGRF